MSNIEIILDDWFEIEIEDDLLFIPKSRVGIDQIRTDFPNVIIYTLKQKWGARIHSADFKSCSDWSLHDTKQMADDYIKEVTQNDT